MREVLSRGKRADNGKWIYGFYFYDNRPSGGHFIMYFDGYKQIVEEVIPETVGQSTGLTDKNGVKIFEGDVAKHKNPNQWHNPEQLFEVMFCISNTRDGEQLLGCGFEFKPRHKGLCTKYTPSRDFEVIGNIHDDNPELLEG